MNVNVNFMVESVIQIETGIIINVNESAKKHICEKDPGILLHVVVKMVNI